MKRVLIAFGCVCLLAWGFAMGRYEFWPFLDLQRVKLYFFPYKPDYVLPLDVNTYLEMRREHLEMLGTRAEVVMLGDSLTELGEWQEMFPEVKIANRGISSDTTSGILERLDEVLEAQPRKVFLMAGINDLSWGGVDEGVVLKNMGEITRRLKAQGVEEVVLQATIFPGKNHGADLPRKVERLNKGLVKLASEQGMEFVDLNGVLAPDGFLKTDFTMDGIHLNGKAYKVWAERLAPLMKSGW
jgi:lysophospholipase L1-like esterase